MRPAPAADDLDVDHIPLYVALARKLREGIEGGAYAYGALLPSAQRLSLEHGVSKSTALHALAALVQSGHARHGEAKPHQVIWQKST